MKAILLVILLLLFPLSAQAFPYYVYFSFDSDPSDLIHANTHGSGWFSFEDYSIPENTDKPSFYPDVPLSVSWNNINWDNSLAYMYALSFNKDGLWGWDLLSNDSFYNQSPFFFAIKAGKSANDNWLVYHYIDNDNLYRGNGSWYISDQSPLVVTEPGGLMLGFIACVAVILFALTKKERLC